MQITHSDENTWAERNRPQLDMDLDEAHSVSDNYLGDADYVRGEVDLVADEIAEIASIQLRDIPFSKLTIQQITQLAKIAYKINAVIESDTDQRVYDGELK